MKGHTMTTRSLVRRLRLPVASAAVGLLVAVGAWSAQSAAATGGHGHTPVTICHNGHTIVVDDSAVPGHLRHGDTLGACPTSEPTPPATETPTPEPTTPPVTETPTPEPTDEPSTPVTTPPVQTPEPTPTATVPADVIAPQIQDYITCKGGAFVLDNSGSTVAVSYSVNGLIFDVPAGAVVHTDADGTLLQPNSDFAGYTITAGDRTWNFPSAGNCPNEPTTPPTSEPTEPPVTTPPTDEPSTPTDQPTAPDSPAATPPSSGPQPGPSGSSAPVATSTPTAVVVPSNSGTPAPRATAGTLAYTGISDGTKLAALLSIGLLAAAGAVLLTVRTRRRRADR